MAEADPTTTDSAAIETNASPSEAASPGISNTRMALLFTVMLVTAAGNTAMQSVMPSIGTALQVEDFWISLAYSWSALLWVVCAPIWARRSDRRGRKAMMALGLIGFVVSMALCGVALWAGLAGYLGAATALFAFAAARSLYGGFGSAAPPAVQAYVASRTAPSERTQALSLVASSFGLGTVFGPVLAPLMVLPFFGFGLTGPFICYALLGLAALIVLRLRLPNDEPRFAARGRAYGAPYGGGSHPAEAAHHEDEAEAPHDHSETSDARLKWSDRRVRPWVIAMLIGGHAQAMLLGIVGFLTLDRLGLRDNPQEGAAIVSLVLVFGAIATLLAQWGLIPRFKIGPRAATLSGVTVAACGTAIFGGSSDLFTLALGYAIASLGFGLFRPGTTAGTSLSVSRAEQGQASGIVASTAGASFIYAPPLGVWLYNQSAWLGIGLVIAFCVLVAIIGWRGLQQDEALIREG
ncbi:MAG: MFS transporter [Pseudomonadota bacterium]